MQNIRHNKTSGWGRDQSLTLSSHGLSITAHCGVIDVVLSAARRSILSRCDKKYVALHSFEQRIQNFEIN